MITVQRNFDDDPIEAVRAEITQVREPHEKAGRKKKDNSLQ